MSDFGDFSAVFFRFPDGSLCPRSALAMSQRDARLVTAALTDGSSKHLQQSHCQPFTQLQPSDFHPFTKQLQQSHLAQFPPVAQPGPRAERVSWHQLLSSSSLAAELGDGHLDAAAGHPTGSHQLQRLSRGVPPRLAEGRPNSRGGRKPGAFGADRWLWK